MFFSKAVLIAIISIALFSIHIPSYQDLITLKGILRCLFLLITPNLEIACHFPMPFTLFSFLNCTKWNKPSSNINDKQINSSNCVFCNYPTPERILYQDESFIAFNDISPAANKHILIVPRDHIESVFDLNQTHIEMLTSMKRIGQQLVGQDGKFGFHVPPFISVRHLHLHCFQLPFKNWVKRLVYPKGNSKWGRWFVDVDILIEGIARNGKDGGNWSWKWI